jgi:DNA-directed RNA polymerase specialized sigma24 family protein
MSERTDELLDELVRLVALDLRKGMETQAEAIAAFTGAGLRPQRIAELLGTTTGTVNSAQQKAKNRKKATRATK